MAEKTLDQLIDNLVTLPTIPAALAKLNTVIEDPDSSAQDIASVVSTDQSIATKVLRISNSTFYGLRTKVSSLAQAVSILGTRVIRNLVLQATTIQSYQHLRNNPDFDIDAFWEHSIRVAVATQIFAKHCKGFPMKPDECYTIGLVHDVGRVVLLDGQPKSFIESVRWAASSGEDSASSENRVFGFNHTHVGELLAQRWKLPTEVAIGIRHHHSAPDTTDPSKLPAVLVSLADRLAHNLKDNWNREAAAGLDPVALDLLKLPIEKTIDITEEIMNLSSSVEV